jgi:hypothetical protein
MSRTPHPSGWRYTLDEALEWSRIAIALPASVLVLVLVWLDSWVTRHQTRRVR